MPNGKWQCYKSVYYRDVILKKLQKYYQTHLFVSAFRHFRLLHDNAPSRTSELVKQVLKSEKVTVLSHPPYSPDPSPCEFCPFSKITKFLTGRRYKSWQACGSVISQSLRGLPIFAYHNTFQKWIDMMYWSRSSSPKVH